MVAQYRYFVHLTTSRNSSHITHARLSTRTPPHFDVIVSCVYLRVSFFFREEHDENIFT